MGFFPSVEADDYTRRLAYSFCLKSRFLLDNHQLGRRHGNSTREPTSLRVLGLIFAKVHHLRDFRFDGYSPTSHSESGQRMHLDVIGNMQALNRIQPVVRNGSRTNAATVAHIHGWLGAGAGRAPALLYRGQQTRINAFFPFGTKWSPQTCLQHSWHYLLQWRLGCPNFPRNNRGVAVRPP